MEGSRCGNKPNLVSRVGIPWYNGKNLSMFADCRSAVNKTSPALSS